MFYSLSIRTFLIFIGILIGGSHNSVFSHELSDTIPDFWGSIENDFYDSIANANCNIEELAQLKKTVFRNRKKIKTRILNIEHNKSRLSILRSKEIELQQTITNLKVKLLKINSQVEKRKALLFKINTKQRTLNYVNEVITGKTKTLNYKQNKVDSDRQKLAQAESTYAKLNAKCGSIAGVWQSEGYGYLVDILGHRLRTYHVTSNICRRDETFDQDESVFDNYDLYQLVSHTQNIKVAQQDELPYQITFRRIDALPAHCLAIRKNNPVANLEVFSSFFDQHYPFFSLYGVDWDEEIRNARSLVTNNTSGQALFDVFKGMLANLKDGHIFLEAIIEEEAFEFDADPFDIDVAISRYAERNDIDIDVADDLFLDNYINNDIKSHILNGLSFSDSEGVVYYGMTSGDIGYIAITAEEIIGENSLQDIQLTDEFMDDAIRYFKLNNAKAVIIDLSINYGGFDSVSRTIAERFAAQSTVAYSKRAGDFSNSQKIDITIAASSGLQFLGPTYVMTSDATISAGEILVLSLRALPNVTHVGEATNGALSDQLQKELPNGWLISLSNEIYTDHNNVNWEAIGIEPDIFIPVFDLQNPLGSAHRNAIDTLIELIDDEHP